MQKQTNTQKVYKEENIQSFVSAVRGLLFFDKVREKYRIKFNSKSTFVSNLCVCVSLYISVNKKKNTKHKSKEIERIQNIVCVRVRFTFVTGVLRVKCIKRNIKFGRKQKSNYEKKRIPTEIRK